MQNELIKRGNYTKISYTGFITNKGIEEYQAVIEVTSSLLSFMEQIVCIRESLAWLRKERLNGAQSVFKRYFLSDIINQAKPLLLMESSHCAVSLVGQPPLNGTKVALWVCLQTDVLTRKLPCGLYETEHNGYRHLRSTCNTKQVTGSEAQTRFLLNDYIMQLSDAGCSLALNCIRTWFYVQDIDNNYAGMVKARNDVFFTEGLTSKTHFIASTGIEGNGIMPKTFIMMDNYAIGGIDSRQIRYLKADSYLSSTSIYGVSFERGTEVIYGDRRHIYLSGTASIDSKGEVIGECDIQKQVLRMWENVEALLVEACANTKDLTSIIVYLRDLADYTVVEELFSAKYSTVPTLYVRASVCRPQWLIEMECIAVVADRHSEFRNM